MRNIFGLYLIGSFVFFIVVMFAGCSQKESEVVIPIKPNLPKVEKAREGNNTYESLINILSELDKRRAVESSYR